MENTNVKICQSTGFDPPYNSYDKHTLIKILTSKDEFIQQARNRVTQLLTEVQVLKENNTKLDEEIKKLRSGVPKDSKIGISTGDVEETGYGEKPMPDWSVLSSNTDTFLSISEVVRATAEAEFVTETGTGDPGTLKKGQNQNADPNSEYVYDSTSGYYYHPPTGYYWDPNSGLLYDYTTSTYFRYNETSGEYEVHSQLDTETQDNSKKTKHSISSLSKSAYAKTLSGLKSKKRARKKRKKSLTRKKKGLSSEQDKSNEEANAENDNDTKLPKAAAIGASDSQEPLGSEGELSGSLASDESELESDPESGEIISSSSSEAEIMEVEEEEMALEANTDHDTVEVYTLEQKLYEEAMADNYPPCIRVIVQESDKLSAGTLFIVTCTGGTIGRNTAKNHSVEIPDVGVSKNHAKIEYDTNDSCYKVMDLGSQNGTYVNGKMVKQSEDCKEPLSHGDELVLGISTKLLLHIHKGNETCEDCEPGQIQAKLKALNPVKNTHVVMTKAERRQHQKKELKSIKKKYGLQNSYFENEGAVINDPNYADKAFLRRTHIGSENENARPASRPASVHCPIESSNKGHKLLAKMGWKEGQGLGKANAGISEPITVGLRVNQNSGLGSEEGQSMSLDRAQDTNKAKRWSQARHRFNQLQQTSTETNPSPSSSSKPQVGDNSDGATNFNVAASTYLPENVPNYDNNSRDVLPQQEPSPSVSSLSSVTSLSLSSNWVIKPGLPSKFKPQMKWHRGATETFPGPSPSENKDL